MHRIANPFTSVRLRAQPPFCTSSESQSTDVQITDAHSTRVESPQTTRSTPTEWFSPSPCPGGEIGRRKGLKIPR